MLIFPKALLVGLGIALVIEGAPWFLSPRAAKRMLREIGRLPDQALRVVGLLLMLAGLLLVSLFRF